MVKTDKPLYQDHQLLSIVHFISVSDCIGALCIHHPNNTSSLGVLTIDKGG